MFFYPDAAIAREKEIKGWRRSKKIKLIESMNPHWCDLAAEWGNEFKPSAESTAAARGIPFDSAQGRLSPGWKPGFGMTPPYNMP